MPAAICFRNFSASSRASARLREGWLPRHIGKVHRRTQTPVLATVLVSLAVLVLAMGIYPKPFTDVMHVSVDALIKHVAVGKLN